MTQHRPPPLGRPALRAGLFFVLVLLQACAVCQRHQTACNVAAVGAAALAIGAVVVFHDNRQKTGCTCGCPGTPPCR